VPCGARRSWLGRWATVRTALQIPSYASPQVEESCKPQCVKALLAYQARATALRYCWPALSSSQPAGLLRARQG